MVDLLRVEKEEGGKGKEKERDRDAGRREGLGAVGTNSRARKGQLVDLQRVGLEGR